MKTIDHQLGYASAMARRLKLRRSILAGLAVVFSLAFHGMLAVYAPLHLVFGDRQSVAPPPAREFPTFDVEIQHEQWQRALIEMDVLRFQSHDRTPEGIDAEPETLASIDPVVFEPDVSPENLLSDMMEAEAEIRDTAPVVDVGPGQKILQITEQIAADTHDDSRRPLMPEGERTAYAPDIVVPSADPDLHARASDATLDGILSDAGFGAVVGDGQPPAINRAAAAPRRSEGIERLTDAAASQPIDEAAEAITPIGAVDPYLMVRARKYTGPRGREAFVEISIERYEADDASPAEMFLDVLPKDIFFIQDLSGSMGDRRVEACAEGMRLALERLSPEDRFNIITFAHEPGQYAEDWVPATPGNIRQAQAFADAMRSDGMTDIDAALDHILEMDRDPARPTLAVMLTDGIPTAGVTNSTRIIESFTVRNRGAISMSAVAVASDTIANMYLLDMLTYRNRGDATVIRTGREEIPLLIDQFSRETARPVLTDLRYRFTRSSQCEAYPDLLSNLYLDRPLTIYGKMPANQTSFAFQVVGRSGGQLYDFVFELNLDNIIEGDEAIRRQWARHRIYSLIGEHMRTDDNRVLRELFDTQNKFGVEIPYLDDFAAPRRLPWR